MNSQQGDNEVEDVQVQVQVRFW